jgi:hypothetical protein
MWFHLDGGRPGIPDVNRRRRRDATARKLPSFYQVACAPKPLWPSPSMPLVATTRVAFVETPSSYGPPQPFKASPMYSRDEVATPTAAVYGSSVFDNAGAGEAHP